MSILEYEFMQHAIAAGILASIICGIMGSLIVVNRIVFLSGGIAHAAYGGIGMAYFFKWPVMFSTLGFSFIASMLMAAVTFKVKHRADTIIGVIWALGMAIGIILIDLTPGYNVDLMSYLFGSILTVSKSSLFLMLGITILLFLFVTFYYNELLAASYDEEFAQVRGVRVKQLYFILIGMLGLTIVMIIQVVGLIMVIALLTIPPFIMENKVKSLLQMMIGASVLGAFFTLTGLWMSYRFNLTSGASIILVAGTVFLLNLVAGKIQKNLQG